MNRDDQITQKIRELLDSQNIEYEYVEHEPTPTSEDADRVLGTTSDEGVKALIFKTSKTGKNFMVILSCDVKVDFKKVKQFISEDFSFENPDVILEKYGIIVGGVPPFWNIINEVSNIQDSGPFLIDKKIFNVEKINFNCGKQTCSIIMESKDFRKVINGVEGDWSK